MKTYEPIIEKALQLLAPAHPLKVFISSGHQSYTDGETIVLGLPEVLSKETIEVRYAALKALAFHELGHVLYSSMANKEWVVETLSSHFENTFNIPYKIGAYIFRQLENAIEDGRIEFYISRQSKLMGQYLSFLNQRLFEEANLQSTYKVLRFLDMVLVYSKTNSLASLEAYRSEATYGLLLKTLPALKKALRAPTPRKCGAWIISMLLQVDEAVAELIQADLDKLESESDQTTYLEVTCENRVAKAARIEIDFSPIPCLDMEEVASLLMSVSEEIQSLVASGAVIEVALTGPGPLSKRRQNGEGPYQLLEVPYKAIEVDRRVFPPVKVPASYIQEGLKLKRSIKLIMDKQLLHDHRPLRHGKLNKKRLTQIALGNDKIFTKRRWLIQQSAMAILIDFSSSMSGKKLETAIHAASVVEIGSRGQVPVSISGYTTRGNTAIHYDIKGFDEKVSGMYYTYSFYKSGLYDSASNRDDVAICLEGQALLKRHEGKKILFVISDGLPCVRDEKMLKAIRDLEDKGVDIYALIVQSPTGHEKAPKKPEWFKQCVYTGEEGLMDNLNALIRQGIKGV